MEEQQAFDTWTQAIEEACQSVWDQLGSGKAAAEYGDLLETELQQRNLKVARNARLPLSFLHHQIEDQFEVGLLVENEILVEVPEDTQLKEYLAAQLETSLQLTGKRTGYLAVFEPDPGTLPRRLDNPQL
ncbi:MAG: GxxExxY protein [Salibacteraceae bacterium]